MFRKLVVAFFASLLIGAQVVSAEELVLDSKENSVIVDPARVTLPYLSPGRYGVVLGGPGVSPYGGCEPYHYAYLAAYGPDTEINRALFGVGDATVISLPNGGYISAFLQDSYAEDNAGYVTLAINNLDTGEQFSIVLDSITNSAIVDPARKVSSELAPGRYEVLLAGPGVTPYDGIAPYHYAYIAAWGPGTEQMKGLSGYKDKTTISLPNGGNISAFLQDSYADDNSGYVTVRIRKLD